jgi:hypothetical protein
MGTKIKNITSLYENEKTKWGQKKADKKKGDNDRQGKKTL